MRIYLKHKMILPALVILCIALLVPSMISLAQSNPPQVVVNIENLNQRTGPGPEYVVQGVLGGGSILPVIGRAPDDEWWQVQSPLGAGWVSNEYVALRGNFSDVPVLTEYGMLDRPQAIMIAYPVPAYQLPNPGSRQIGMTIGEAAYPIYGRSYHTGTETWFWLVNTTAGNAWLEDTEQVAVWGFTDNVPILTTEAAFALERTAPVADELVRPPEPTPVPPVPTAESAGGMAVEPGGEASGGEAVPAATAPQVSYLTIADTQLRLLGDCYALPVVNYLLQQSPVRSTALTCTDNATGYSRLLLGQADLSMSVDGGCGSTTETPVAMLIAEDGTNTSHTLSFCTNGPNRATSTFLAWVQGPTGGAAIQTYKGLPGSQAPQSAVPLN